MSVSGDSRAPGDEQRRENPPWNKDSKHSQERPPNPRLRAPGKVSFQALGGRAGVPAVAFAGTLDQLASRPCRSGCFLASRRAACSDASPSRRCASARIGDPRGGQERQGRDLYGRGVAKALGLAGHVPGTEERRVPVGDDVHGADTAVPSLRNVVSCMYFAPGHGCKVLRCLVRIWFSRHARPPRPGCRESRCARTRRSLPRAAGFRIGPQVATGTCAAGA